MMGQTFYTTCAALLGCAALWHATDGFRAVTAEGARRIEVAEAPVPVPPFPLQVMDGRWIDFPGSGQAPVLLEFIYTACPTVCQVSGGDFAELGQRLAAAGRAVPMYSISFDPVKDDLAALQSYAEDHGATGGIWTVARPTPADLARILGLFGVTVIPDGWGGYTHNVAVLLIDRNGAFAGAFDTRDFEAIRAAVEAAS